MLILSSCASALSGKAVFIAFSLAVQSRHDAAELDRMCFGENHLGPKKITKIIEQKFFILKLFKGTNSDFPNLPIPDSPIGSPVLLRRGSGRIEAPSSPLQVWRRPL